MPKNLTLNIQKEFEDYLSYISTDIPIPAKLFAETSFLAGATSVLAFTTNFGPKGSSGFLQPTKNEIEQRLAFINALQEKMQQDEAAYSKSN